MNSYETVHTMYCFRPKEIERCNGSQCPYEHRWSEEQLEIGEQAEPGK